MKASDLRIFNWVNDSNEGISQIGFLDIRSQNVGLINPLGGSHDGTCLEFIKPIPLTEDWLYKFDFYNKGYERVNTYEVNTSVMCFGEDDKIKIKFVKEWYDSTEDKPNYYIQLYKDYDSIRTIKYVHELQNLYFALTGEELIYEES